MKVLFWFLCLHLFFSDARFHAQEKLLEEIVAVVGTHSIFLSELQAGYQQAIYSFGDPLHTDVNSDSVRQEILCSVLEQMILNKLLYEAALRDSLEVSETQVDAELDRRLQAFLQAFGSIQALESFYGKSYDEIRRELRRLLREHMLAEQKRQKILQNVTVSPGEVEEFYHRLVEESDTLPLIEARYSVGILVRWYEPEPWQWEYALEEAQNLIDKLHQGTRFEVLASLYSDHEASRKQGGFLGWKNWQELPPHLRAYLLEVDSGDLLGPIRGPTGWEIYRIDGKKGLTFALRYILIRPEITRANKDSTRAFLLRLREQILAGEISFEEAARLYSQDENTRYSGGMLLDFSELKPEIPASHLPEAILKVLATLKPGEISEPIPYSDGEREGEALVYLARFVPAHPLSLQWDYDLLASMALQQRKQEILHRWMQKEMSQTYVFLAPDYQQCAFWREFVQAQQNPVSHGKP